MTDRHDVPVEALGALISLAALNPNSNAAAALPWLEAQLRERIHRRSTHIDIEGNRVLINGQPWAPRDARLHRTGLLFLMALRDGMADAPGKSQGALSDARRRLAGHFEQVDRRLAADIRRCAVDDELITSGSL